MSNDMTWAIQLVWNLHDADIMENGKNWTNERDTKTQKKKVKWLVGWLDWSDPPNEKIDSLIIGAALLWSK